MADQHFEIEVTDRDGWRKTFTLDRSIVHIGTDRTNDLVLDPQRGGEVTARHAQLILIPGQGCRLVNLSDRAMEVDGDELKPHTSMPLPSGSRLSLGDFELAFQFESEVESRSIGLSMSLPRTKLKPGDVVEGGVVVRNLGEGTGVQFKLASEGLAPACYEIGTGPILFPNASKTVPLRIAPPVQDGPPAGTYRLVVRATAQDAYPDEVAMVSQEIQLLPHYQHTVRVQRVDDARSG
jgi:hypothetical protein